MATTAATPESSSSRQSSSSPRGSPSRASTPSQSSASSDSFLPSDAPPQTPWTPFNKHAAASLFDDENRKPAVFDAHYGFGLNPGTPVNSNQIHHHHQYHHHNIFQSSPQRGILLEDLMQEDAFEYVSSFSMIQTPTDGYFQFFANNRPTSTVDLGASPSSFLVSSFSPSLPSAIPAYPSPSPSTISDISSTHNTGAQNGLSSPFAAPASAPQRTPLTPASSTSSPTSGQMSYASVVDAEYMKRFLVTAPSATVPATPVVSPPMNSVARCVLARFDSRDLSRLGPACAYCGDVFECYGAKRTGQVLTGLGLGLCNAMRSNSIDTFGSRLALHLKTSMPIRCAISFPSFLSRSESNLVAHCLVFVPFYLPFCRTLSCVGSGSAPVAA